MPPKKVTKKLHELAAEVKVGHKLTDTKKRSYIVGKQFATGGFGRIHICHEEGKSNELVMKIEPADNGPLFTEVNVFQRILKPEQIEEYKKKNKMKWIGLPYLISSGIFSYGLDKMRYMVIPKYAVSLESIREKRPSGKFSIKEAMEVSTATLMSLEYLHEMDYTHADVKAANILLEKPGNFTTSVLVDFGLARLSSKNEDKPDKKRAHNGTCIFTSIDAHRGCHPSFRGDVEILAYNVIYWLTGTLPWMAFESSPEKVYEEKKKFIAGLPGTLKNVLKDNSAAISFVSQLFDVSQKTNYSSKLDFVKLIQSAAKISSETTSSKSPKPVATPSRRRKSVVVETESDGEVEEVKTTKAKKKETPKKTQNIIPKGSGSLASARSRLRAAAVARASKAPKRASQEPETSPPPKKSSPSQLKSVTTRKATILSTAKKIEKKYKRISLGRAILQPVMVATSPVVDLVASGSSRLSGGADLDLEQPVIKLRTPAAVAVSKTLRTKSGISSDTKASPTKLRSVPGMRNFPRGRRSIFISETAVRYSNRGKKVDTEEE